VNVNDIFEKLRHARIILKINLKEIVPDDRVQWQVLINMVMNIPVPYKTGKFYFRAKSFQVRTLFTALMH
jgi:hypothetical protein